ncbi:MAG: hypothetical protein WDO18_08580 [Acidobacteriota bacterium]
MLREFAGAEIGLIEQLKAEPARLRQPRRRQLQSDLGDTILFDQDCSSASDSRYSILPSRSFAVTAPPVLRRHAGKQGSDSPFLIPQTQPIQPAHHRQRGDGERQPLLRN